MSQETIKTILIVDDDPGQIKLLESVLTDEGYDVKSTGEADRGLQMAMNDIPDLILLDVMMPIINGYHFCKLLKDQEISQKVSVILVTSRDEEADIQIGLDMGADAYVCKPINTQEMLKTIKLVEQQNHATNSQPTDSS